MEYPLLNSEKAAEPLSDVHRHKTRDELVLEKDLYILLGSVFVGGQFSTTFTTGYSDSTTERSYPYHSVTTKADGRHQSVFAYRCQGEVDKLDEDDFPHSTDPEEELNRRMDKKSKYFTRADWMQSHMIFKPFVCSTSPGKSLEPLISLGVERQQTPSIISAVRIAIRTTETLRLVATGIETTAMALGKFHKKDVEIAAEDARLKAMIGTEESNPWKHRWSRLDDVPGHYVMEYADKPINRIGFEAVMNRVFNCYIVNERIRTNERNFFEGVVVKATGSPKMFCDLTPEDKKTHGAIYIPEIKEDMIAGRTLNAIQSSLILAHGYRVIAWKIETAVDQYFSLRTLALAMTLHERLGKDSSLGKLDINTLRMIVANCVVWIEHEDFSPSRCGSLPVLHV